MTLIIGIFMVNNKIRISRHQCTLNILNKVILKFGSIRTDSLT